MTDTERWLYEDEWSQYDFCSKEPFCKDSLSVSYHTMRILERLAECRRLMNEAEEYVEFYTQHYASFNHKHYNEKYVEPAQDCLDKMKAQIKDLPREPEKV